MSNQVSLQLNTQDFRTKLRDGIMAAFMNLIPAEQLDAMIDAEVKAFFETEQLLVVQETQVEMANPRYNPMEFDRWGAEKPTVKIPALAFGSKMTPFRQLVWSVMHQHLKPLVEDYLDHENSVATKELDKWFNEHAKPDLKQGYRSMFSDLAVGMQAAQLRNTISMSMTQARNEMRANLAAAGINLPGN